MGTSSQYDWRLAPQYASPGYDQDLTERYLATSSNQAHGYQHMAMKDDASSTAALTKAQAANSDNSIHQAERPPGLPPHLTYGYGQQPGYVVQPATQTSFAQLPQSIP